ncbi:hypothetical protein JMUB7496_27260 [Staphylococcus aureus]
MMPILEVLGQVLMEVLCFLLIGIVTNVMSFLDCLWTLIKIGFQGIGTVISVAGQIIVGLFTA